MNKPDFFIVGAPKCGTTSLHSYLNQHPEIFMTPNKDINFFNGDIVGDRRDRCRWTVAEYLDQFAGANGHKRIGDAQVHCLASPLAPQEIKALNPAAQIIIMLRNPVDMMYALHSENVWCTIDDITNFAEALRADEESDPQSKRQGLTRPWLSYRDTARFARQVRRYFDVFGREKVHVIIYDDFSKGTPASYRKTLQFLDVRDDFQPEFEVVNSSHRPKSMRLQHFITHPPKVLHKIGTSRIRRFVSQSVLVPLNTLYERRQPMDPNLRGRLLKEFEPEVEELSTLLGRDLSSWCKSPNAQ
ncbi:MAG: sulfotransferase [Bryobacteraceae bacterium]